MSDSAAGRVALITGGAQGLGLAIGQRLLLEGFAGVMLTDRNGEKLIGAKALLEERGQVEVFTGELLDPDTPRAAIEATIAAFGRIDVLVNAAGNTERCGIDEVTPESYERLFGVNVKAPLFLIQEAVRHMRIKRRGVIINVSSMLAHGGPPNLTIYSASKAALNILTKSAANTYKRDGIRVFGVNLGWAATAGEHELQTRFHKLPQDWAEKIGKRMPFGRLITADDVAGLCAFLVSDPAQMMTGTIVDYEQMPAGTFDVHPALAPE
jgi:NAD(P)-dependent dehydrogenase (short-subunit alcohol dehydrogenase family)